MTTTGPAGANDARPRSRDAARTRELVLGGAMAEFTAKGFAGARIDAVAERAGVNVRAIYQHFESKAALFDAVVGDSVHRRHERLLTEMAGLFDVPHGLAEVLPLFRRVLGDTPGWVRLMAWKELSEDPDAGAADIASGPDRQPLYRREIALLDAARERGQIPPGLDSDLLLIALTGLASFPWFVRPLTLLVTEQSPESPEFLARWDAFLLALGRALVGAEAGDAPRGADPGGAAPHRHRELRMLGRALDRAGLAGAFGHCSLRVDADTFLVTPPHPLRVLGTRPCVAAPVQGPLPDGVLPEVRLDQAVYRARPDVGALAAIAPAAVVALARAGRRIGADDPHAAYFGDGPVRHDGPESPADDAGAAALAAALGTGTALVHHGGAVVVGETAARTLALAVFLDEAAAAALRGEPAAPTAQALGREDAAQALGREDAAQALGRERAAQALGREDAAQALGRGHAAQALGKEPAAHVQGGERAAPAQVATWADRRAERMWEYATAGDPEAVAPT